MERPPSVTVRVGGKVRHSFLPQGEAQSMVLLSVRLMIPPLSMAQSLFHQEERQLMAAIAFCTHFPIRARNLPLLLVGARLFTGI